MRTLFVTALCSVLGANGHVQVAYMSATKMAETLPTGPGPVVDGTELFCTDCFTGTTNTWIQTFDCDGDGADEMTIKYTFGSSLSLLNQICTAVASGVTVSAVGR